MFVNRIINFTPKNIIVRMPNWVGDLVLATPILLDLRKKFPESSITAMCLTHLAPLLEYEDSINELFAFSTSTNLLHRIMERNLIEKLRIGKYDLGVLATNSFSSAWRFWQGKVGSIIGFKRDCRSLFLDYPVPFKQNYKKQHLVLTYKAILEPLGIPISTTPPRLVVTEKEMEEAWKFLKRYNLSEKDVIIGINPGAAFGSAKCWLPERFREVAKRLVEADPKHVVLFFGDLSQKRLTQDICLNLPARVINLAGKTTIRELMALLKICRAFLTNDSGPMHIADSLHTPLVALFGSTDKIVTAPYVQRDQVICKPVACSPCLKRVCPIDFPCMKKIEVDEVFDKMMRLIQGCHV